MVKIDYKTRLFLYFFFVFTVFTGTVIWYQQIREKQYKRHLIEEQLSIYCNIAEKDYHDNSLPDNIRITVINNGGEVIFDNNVDNVDEMENHFDRPEIKEAIINGHGSDIRQSKSVGVPFVYYAKKIERGFIRTALPYDVEIRSFLQAEHSFIFLVLSLFVISMFLLWQIATRFGRDISRLKADVLAQQKARMDLKSEMTNSIAHELRTPVSAIRGYTETLLEEDLPENTRIAFTRRAYDAAVRLSDLLRDVALLSKLEEADKLFKKEEVFIYEIVNDVIEEFAGKIDENSVKVENSLPQYISITGNQTLIYSIFRNLIENSLKHAGKWITLKIELTGEDNDFYFFSVSDSGIGVDEHYLNRIFERFFRVSDGRSREDGGSGLGLSIVRHAILYHGGTVSASNQYNTGFKVTFSLKKQ
jgi:signal transduction histidine kinase